MSQINVDAIRASNGSGDAISLASASNTATANLTQINSVPFPSSGALSNRNLVINGAMTINQRMNATGKTATGYYGPDRYNLDLSGHGTWSITQSTDAPAGFANSYLLECTTAGAAPAASDKLCLEHRIEAQNLQHLKYGSSDAVKTTLSFWVKSANSTGNIQVNFRNIDGDRLISAVVPVTTSWVKKTITIAGDTNSGDGYENNANLGFLIGFFLAAGTDYTSGSAPSAWEDRANTDLAAGVTLANGSDKFGLSTSDKFYISGIQYEVGDYATDFEHRSYGDELAKCQRYFYNVKGSGNYMHLYTIRQYDNIKRMTVQHPVEMRAAPTCTFDTVSEDSGGTISANWTSQYWMQWAQSGGTSAQAGSVSEFSVSAEL